MSPKPDDIERIDKILGYYTDLVLEGGTVREKGSGLEFEPITLPKVGDFVDTSGYVWQLKIDQPKHPLGDPTKGAETILLESRTYLTVTISADRDKAESLQDYRLLWSGQEYEELAISMAMVATLKDAFTHRSKVQVWGLIAQVKHRHGPPAPVPEPEVIESLPFRLLKAVQVTK